MLTCLAVGEDAGVVSLERVVQDVSAHRVEHTFLRGEVVEVGIDRVETMVECEGFRLFSVIKKWE